MGRPRKHPTIDELILDVKEGSGLCPQDACKVINALRKSNKALESALQEAQAEIKKLEEAAFKLAAGVCEHKVGDDYGNPTCKYREQLEARMALMWHTNKPPEAVELLIQFRNECGLHNAIARYEPRHARVDGGLTSAWFFETSSGRGHKPETVEHWIRLDELLSTIEGIGDSK